MNKHSELKVEATLENLSVIADFLANTMNNFGIPEHLYAVQTAVDEACSNVMNYAYAGAPGTITVSCELQNSVFVVTIRDQGKPFDPTRIPPPDLDSELENRRIGGLGMYFMKKLMDEVTYTFSDNENKLVMKKKVGGSK